MEHIFFFMRDKRRLKFFLYIVAVGMPILIISALVINHFDTKSMAEGYDNDKGGKTYMYRENSGIDKFPDPVAALITMYPGSETTYINVSTDSAGNMGGNIYSFTKDDFSKVVDFYTSAGNVISRSENRLELEKNGTVIIIAKEKVYDSDPIKGQTKFNIFFPSKK
ncbi:MAG: hypothetical protein FWF54_05460 [Candidatus Azobacteroides sp.]|nr:hypothetical protein [Candidatus Azobacteroides sp.]